MKVQIFITAFAFGMFLFILGQIPGVLGTPTGNNVSAVGGAVMAASMILVVVLLFYMAGKL
jgi:hypothetical protein